MARGISSTCFIHYCHGDLSVSLNLAWLVQEFRMKPPDHRAGEGLCWEEALWATAEPRQVLSEQTLLGKSIWFGAWDFVAERQKQLRLPLSSPEFWAHREACGALLSAPFGCTGAAWGVCQSLWNWAHFSKCIPRINGLSTEFCYSAELGWASEESSLAEVIQAGFHMSSLQICVDWKLAEKL